MATNNSSDVATGALNTILLGQGIGTSPIWSTATYLATTTINQLLYSSAANVVSGLATANNGTLVTSATGVPSILAGPGTTGQILQANSAAAPSWSTASYPSTTTINQLLYSSAANTVAGLATANSAVLVTTSAGVPVMSSTMTNGQVIIGSTGATPTAATLSAGAGIAITNAGGSITIANTGAGFTWTDVTGATQTLAAQNGYVTDRAGGVTYTLPASGVLGDEIVVVGKSGIATLAQNANQQILISSSSSTVGVGGSLVADIAGCCITLTCITAGASTVWRASTSMGNWTVN